MQCLRKPCEQISDLFTSYTGPELEEPEPSLWAAGEKEKQSQYCWTLYIHFHKWALIRQLFAECQGPGTGPGHGKGEAATCPSLTITPSGLMSAWNRVAPQVCSLGPGQWHWAKPPVSGAGPDSCETGDQLSYIRCWPAPSDRLCKTLYPLLHPAQSFPLLTCRFLGRNNLFLL